MKDYFDRQQTRLWRDRDRFTSGWVTDLWDLPSGDKEEYDWTEYPKRTTPIWCSLSDCIVKTDDTFKCCDCGKRELGIPWLPNEYNKWTDLQKEEWKARLSKKH
tara:strand:- start:5955 stop:6266 length:312 start_codon:yes stop_codon:yes gene_type:complete